MSAWNNHILWPAQASGPKGPLLWALRGALLRNPEAPSHGVQGSLSGVWAEAGKLERGKWTCQACSSPALRSFTDSVQRQLVTAEVGIRHMLQKLLEVTWSH